MEDGRLVSSFEDEGEEGARYFHSLYQALTSCPIQEILQVVPNSKKYLQNI